MKFKTCFLILTLIVFSCQKEPKVIEGGFNITVTVENVKNELPVYLKTQENGLLITIDSTTVENDKFEFVGLTDKPAIYGIFLKDFKDAIVLFIENKDITIEAYKDSLSTSKILGSVTNDLYLDFSKESNRITSKMNTLFAIFQKARAENNAEKLEEINAKMRVINNENTKFALKYAKENPNSYVAALALHSVLGIPSIANDSVTDIYNSFSDYVKKGDYSKKIELFLESTQKIDSIQN